MWIGAVFAVIAFGIIIYAMAVYAPAEPESILATQDNCVNTVKETIREIVTPVETKETIYVNTCEPDFVCVTTKDEYGNSVFSAQCSRAII